MNTTIKTWEDVLRANNETQAQFDKRTEHDTDPQKADKQLEMITIALNPKGYRADFSDNSTKKWWPKFVWDKNKAGFGFDGSAYHFTHTDAGLGPRLCFISEELASYAGRTFLDIYNRSNSCGGSVVKDEMEEFAKQYASWVIGAGQKYLNSLSPDFDINFDPMKFFKENVYNQNK